MELALGKKRFLCIEYPAIVNDEDKMLETIGGVQTVTKVCCIQYTC